MSFANVSQFLLILITSFANGTEKTMCFSVFSTEQIMIYQVISFGIIYFK